jgi:hypothetical protein
MVVQLYVANIPLAEVVDAARAHMEGGTAWEGVGFDHINAPVEPSVVLRGSVANLLRFFQLRKAVALLLARHGEKTAYVETWLPDGRPGGSHVWEALRPAA